MLFFFFRIVYNNYTGDLMNNVFNRLDKIIDKYSNFIIMAHANPDLDALGSSLGLYQLINEKGKKVSIFLDTDDLNNYNVTIKKSIEKLTDINFMGSNDYIVNDDTCLFILDVHSSKRLYYPAILDSVNKVIVLDHHIKRRDFIHNTIYTYIDSNLSSMVEMITFYLDRCNCCLDSVVASIMLAGLEIDTNGYNLKTSSDTYLAASILVDKGADIIFKQELLKETKDEYIKRADYVKHSFRVKHNVAMCILTDKIEQHDLAEIADDLLNFVDVEASFAIGPIGDELMGVSARSMGNIDVEKIMSKLGGGGSKTNAACQSKLSVRDIKKKIVKLLG